MNLKRDDLRVRTRKFALRIIRLYSSLPKTGAARVIADQMLRAGTSVGAHYAEGCHSKSRPDFVSKIEGAMQELEETRYWMELLVEADVVKESKLKLLQQEASELMAIFLTMVKRTKAHSR